jgi:hypothetical protein
MQFSPGGKKTSENFSFQRFPKELSRSRVVVEHKNARIKTFKEYDISLSETLL